MVKAISLEPGLHTWTLLAILLDVALIVLIITTVATDIPLPIAQSKADRRLQDLLPSFAAVIGVVIAGVNKTAIKMLATVHARKEISSSGLTFQQISWLHSYSTGGVPRSYNRLFYTALISLIAAGALTTAMVNTLTPTKMDWTFVGNMSSLSFSADSGVTPDIYCDTGAGDINKGESYGVNCPLDNIYGDMYNAFQKTLTRNYGGDNETTGLVEYDPRELLGVSGGLLSFIDTYGGNRPEVHNRGTQRADNFTTCVPRMAVNVSCMKGLRDGEFYATGHPTVDGSNDPPGIVSVQLCSSRNDTCGPSKYTFDYGRGVITLFQSENTTTGVSTIYIYGSGNYVKQLAASSIQCSISATEEILPVAIYGSRFAKRLNSSEFSCPNRTAPPPLMLANLTRLAGMTLESIQAADGALTGLAANIPGRDRIKVLEKAIKNMLSLAATDMYSTLANQTFVDKNDTLTPESWAQNVTYTYTTSRYRLGFASPVKLVFAFAPLALLAIIITGYILYGFIREAHLGFDPLDPTCVLAAGLNSESVAGGLGGRAGDIKAGDLQHLGVRLRYTTVGDGRMGMEALVAGGVDPDAHRHVDSPTYEKDEKV